MPYSIVEYKPEYQPRFYELNRAWIEQYYTLEEEDKRFLSDPKRYILDGGGQIFFVLDGDEIAGTCGIMKMDDDTYELVRMSVDARFRGRGYAKRLIQHANAWAKTRGAQQVILETGSKLTPAISLYESLGFAHYTPEPKHRSGLARANVFMRMLMETADKAA